jgi:DNA-directed RNA polymerase specialized sigma24 family protein
MQQLTYFFYVEQVVDPREKAMQQLEYVIVCKASKANIHHYTAEDLAQELRILLWESLPTYNPQKASLATWANMVMENRLKNIYKAECQTQKRKNHMAVSFEDWMFTSGWEKDFD